jgi:hypothetical protein
MLGGTLPGCKRIAWSWSRAGRIPLGISKNTLEWMWITFWRYKGVEDIYVWTFSEKNYVITPRCPLFRNIFMLLEIITLEGFPWIPMSLISFPFKENVMKSCRNLRAILPNESNHWPLIQNQHHPFRLQSLDYPINTPS